MKLTLGTLLLAFFIFSSLNAQIEHEPYPEYDTKPVIVQNPYLLDPSENAMTVVWMTDTPSHSKVLYGKEGEDLDQIAESREDGMLPVGAVHSVRIKGLEPGVKYNYKVLSRRVVELNPYWPAMGDWVESDIYEFTTFDRKKPKISFSSVTDTHENVEWIEDLMDLVDWDKTDFFVHTGDGLDWVESEKQLMKNWVSPIAKKLNQENPLIYARGNHELRGPFAREMSSYFPIEEGKCYFARDHGPAHFLVLDSGEDKADSTNVYAGLNRLKDYKEQEYKWFKNHVKTSKSLKEAPFRIVLIHDPRWGWMDGENEKWTSLANEAKVNLVIAGHWHRFKRIEPKSEEGNDYPILVLGQKQIAHVDVTDQYIEVEVEDIEKKKIDAFRIDRKGNIKEM